MSRKEDEEGRGEQKGVLLKGKDPYQRSGSHEDNKNNGVGVVTIVALLKSGFCSPSLHSPYFQSVCLRNLGRALTSDIMQKISLPLLNFEKIIKCRGGCGNCGGSAQCVTPKCIRLRGHPTRGMLHETLVLLRPLQLLFPNNLSLSLSLSLFLSSSLTFSSSAHLFPAAVSVKGPISLLLRAIGPRSPWLSAPQTDCSHRGLLPGGTPPTCFIPPDLTRRPGILGIPLGRKKMPRKVSYGLDYSDEYDAYDDYEDYSYDHEEDKPSQAAQSITKKKAGVWRCPICTYDNDENLSFCEICGVIREAKLGTSDKEKADGVWEKHGASLLAKSLFSSNPREAPEDIAESLGVKENKFHGNTKLQARFDDLQKTFLAPDSNAHVNIGLLNHIDVMQILFWPVGFEIIFMR